MIEKQSKWFIRCILISYVAGLLTYYVINSFIPSSTTTVDTTQLDDITERYNRLKFNYELLVKHQDSIIEQNEDKWKEIVYNKNNKIKEYEIKVQNMSDVSIVSNDSITEFISSRIYNRR